MSEDIKECPFCGSASEWLREHSYNCFLRRLIAFNEWLTEKRLIGQRDERPYSRDELIEAYNTRYKRTCEPITFVADEIENIKLWHTECRLCGVILGQGKSAIDATIGLPNYCPCCGAEVVDVR